MMKAFLGAIVGCVERYTITSECRYAS